MNGNAIFREIGRALGEASGHAKRKRLKTVQVTGPRLTRHGDMDRAGQPTARAARPRSEHRRDLR